MKTRHWLLGGGTVLASAVASILVACGGGSGGSAANSTPQAQALHATGTITAFGSVFVNGTEYSTTGAQVVDGDGDTTNASAASLQVGMNADVDASGTNASTITFTSAVRGEIDSVNATAGTLTVLGQPVLVSSATAFSGTVTTGSGASATTVDLSTATSPLSYLAAGNYVIVHGYIECANASSGSGSAACTQTQIVANLVIVPATAGSYRTGGYVQNLATTTGANPATSFTINGLTVDLGSATQCGAVGTTPTAAACSGVANGQFVVVRSGPTNPPATGSGSPVLTADTVRLNAQAPVLTAGSTVTLEGPASQINTTADTFVVRGITINASGSGVSATVATLSGQRNQIVEVTGTVNADGSITATSITIEQHADLSVSAPLDSANLTATTLSVLGETFTVTSSTRFDDRTRTTQAAFNSTNFNTLLGAGDQVVVSGYTVTTTGSSGSSTQLFATRVVRTALASSFASGAVRKVDVQGLVSADAPTPATGSATGGTITVGGVFTATVAAATPVAGNGSIAQVFTTLTGDLAAGTAAVVEISGVAGSTAGAIDATDAVDPNTARLRLVPSFGNGGNWCNPF